MNLGYYPPAYNYRGSSLGLVFFPWYVTKSSGDYSVAEAACERLASDQFAYVSQRE